MTAASSIVTSIFAFWLCVSGIVKAVTDLPTVTPTIFDSSAPKPQDECPGYKASNVVEINHGLTADLTLGGTNCNVFGTDIVDLSLTVSYQARERLNINIRPKYIGPANSSWFILDPAEDFVRLPRSDGKTTADNSDLKFTWSNEPSFQFAVSRQDGEKLFSTYGHSIVYETQFIEVVTNMVDDYSVYGLAESIHSFRLGTNYTRTLFNADTADVVDANSYGTHPLYQETRYHPGKPSTAHGVYVRNAHAQEWLMRERTLTFRAIGGSLDFYFLSGQSAELTSKSGSRSSALEVIRQYQSGCIVLPAMQQYWAFGFHQCHWGWRSVSDLRDVVSNYSAAGIPLESIWNDIDVYDQYRVFTSDQIGYSPSEMRDFVDYLHSRGQYYVAIQDSNVYFPDPTNATDINSYPAFSRGAELDIFIRDPASGYFYIGENWPGYSVWVDWLNPLAQDYWTSEVSHFHDLVPFDGLWVDLNECQSFCSYSCGSKQPYGTDPTDTALKQQPRKTFDDRNLNDPPYKINNAKPSKQIIEQTIALDATHGDRDNTAEYDVHNLWSIGIAKATYKAMTSILPRKRPFIISRSTFAGSGQYTGHWGGDNEAKWGAMYLSISQSFIMQMSGVPAFGVDTCGFAQDTTEELCARWMELSAFFPFYRNHYADGKRPQEAYVWPTVAEATRRAISIRYSLLTYIYTLFYGAHTRGDTVMRALAWEFPDDISLRETDNEFMLGPALLVTPVLEPNVRSVRGVFPGIEEGTRWYDWYSLEEVEVVRPHDNVTMQAPLEHINLHVRGGYILPLQRPGNTTTATKANPYSLLVALDAHGCAAGSLYLDDGESIEPDATKIVEFSYVAGKLSAQAWGRYRSIPPLANITVAGLKGNLNHVSLEVGSRFVTIDNFEFVAGTLRITGLQTHTQAGAWEAPLLLRVS